MADKSKRSGRSAEELLEEAELMPGVREVMELYERAQGPLETTKRFSQLKKHQLVFSAADSTG